MARITRLEIDDSGLPAPAPEIEQERRVAVFDLLEDNSFTLPGRDGAPPPEGPFALTLAVRDGRLVFDTATEAGEKVAGKIIQRDVGKAGLADILGRQSRIAGAGSDRAACGGRSRPCDGGAQLLVVFRPRWPSLGPVGLSGMARDR